MPIMRREDDKKNAKVSKKGYRSPLFKRPPRERRKLCHVLSPVPRPAPRHPGTGPSRMRRSQVNLLRLGGPCDYHHRAPRQRQGLDARRFRPSRSQGKDSPHQRRGRPRRDFEKSGFHGHTLHPVRSTAPSPGSLRHTCAPTLGPMGNALGRTLRPQEYNASCHPARGAHLKNPDASDCGESDPPGFVSSRSAPASACAGGGGQPPNVEHDKTWPRRWPEPSTGC